MARAVPEHIRHILDLARWAPSGDNTQPGRFEVMGDEHILVHGLDTREHCVYDLDGHASQLAVGALLETLAIAAGSAGWEATFQRRTDTPETHLLIDVHLQRISEVRLHPLAEFIEKRMVQRRTLLTRPLSGQVKQALGDSLGRDYTVVWYEGRSWRARMARFMFDNAKIRLSIPEAFQVHRSVIEWNARYSLDRIPDQAVGVDPVTLKLMRWAMTSWQRVSFLNRYLLGDLAPRLQLDFLPGLLCAAHFAILGKSPPRGIDDFLEAGRAVQRFWLTACKHGLLLQPEMTPVIFTRYARQQRVFTGNGEAMDLAARLNDRLVTLLPENQVDHLVFMGRMGEGRQPRSRSLRRPLEELLLG
jgi:hypothetical protein